MTDERDQVPAGTTGSASDILAELEAEVAAELEEDALPAGGPVYQVVAALVPLVIGVGGIVLSWSYGLGSLSDPGPGLWPFAVSVLISGMSVLLLAIGPRLTDTEKFTRASWLPIVGSATFVGVALLFPVIGFEVPSVLLCLVWTRFMGGETWRSSILVSVGSVIAFHLLFVELLGVPLPRLF
jgi:putative tricarboxylic transport membrane protein